MTPGYPLKFGKYLLLDRINVGGMAEVFKAKVFGAAGFQRVLAIKRILPSLAEDDEFVRMFIDEARIAVHLQHANVIKIDELGQYGSHYYIAMEYLPSRDLRVILDRNRTTGQLMPIQQAAFIVSRVCDGLDYAHRKKDPTGQPMNIIHRDISPQNVLLGFDGEVKVIDFGIAKAANRASKTQAGVLKGKFAYMSPEQVRGLPTDRRADVFSVGVLLYELLTGERLFIGESDLSTLERVRNAVVPTPTDFNKKISPDLEKIVLKALARDVEDRYQWAGELAEDLGRFQLDGHTLFGGKQLASWMRKSYAQEIAEEQAAMAALQDNEPAGMSPQNDYSLPPAAPVKEPEESGFGSPNDLDYSSLEEAAIPSGEEDAATREVSALAMAVEEESADKTFIIEAAGADDLYEKIAKERAAAAAAVSEPTGDQASGDASLYSAEDDSYEDDAKTEVSFVNPFLASNDTNVSAGPGTPGAAKPKNAVAHKIIDQEEELSLESDEDRTMIRDEGVHYTGDDATPMALDTGVESIIPPAPILSLPGTPPQIPAAASQENELAAPPRAARPNQAPAAHQTAPASQRPPPSSSARAPAPAMDGLSNVTRSPVVATAGDDGPTEYVESATRRKKKSKQIYVVAGGVAASIACLAVAVALLVIKLSGETVSDNPILALTMPEGQSAAGLEVIVDGKVVANAIPSELSVSPAVPHNLEVKGPAGKTWKNGLPPLALGQKLAVKVPNIFSVADTKTSPEEDGAKPPPKKTDEKDDAAVAKEAKKDKGSIVADKKSPAKNETDETKSAAIPADDKGKPAKEGASKPTKGSDKDESQAKDVKAASAAEWWRVSFAAISGVDQASVQGAEVLLDGKVIGVTPFEKEFGVETKNIRLLIKANGFAEKEIELARNGKPQTGPATVRLLALASVKAEAKSAKIDAEKDAPAGGNKKSADTTADAKNAAKEEKPKSVEDPGENKRVAEQDKAVEKVEEPPAKTANQAADSKTRKAPAEKAKEPASNTKAPKTQRTARSSKSKKSSSTGSSRKGQSRSGGSKKMTVLKIGAQPQAKVWIDKKSYGVTPLMHKKAPKLSVGSHFMTIEGVNSKKKYRYKIEIAKDNPKNTLIVYPEGNKIRTKGSVKARRVK
jgi:serine/threonine protein kinase